MYECDFKACGHAKAVAASGWSKTHFLCADHAGKFLRAFKNSPTFRWL